MKLNNDKNMLNSNTENNSSQFSIGNMQVVLDILTRLYSNPIQTLTQEYLSNARDAMRESNNVCDNIDVTLPTKLNSVLKIRDYGIGLSEERINSVFLKYGNSTKRDSNSQTGGFGIGAKSAWSYTDSFIVTSFFDNTKTVYLCHKSNSNGNMDILEQCETSEKNGVEIEIAVNPNDIKYFINAVERATYFWDKQPNFLNNDDIEHFSNNTSIYKMNNELSFVNTSELKFSEYSDKGFIIIDGIPYSLNSEIMNKVKTYSFLKKLTKNSSIGLFFVDNGSVEIAPSREEIIDSELTRNKLDIICKKTYKKVKNEIDDRFKSCETLKDSLKVYDELSGNFIIDRKFGDIKLCNKITGSDFYKGVMNYYWSKPESYYLQEVFFKSKVLKHKTTFVNSEFITNDLVYYIDIDEPMIRTNRRLRTLLNTDIERLVLVSHGQSKLAKKLGAINLSTIVMVDNKVIRSEKIKRDADKIFAHKYTSWGYDSNHFKKEDLESKSVIFYHDYNRKGYNSDVKRWLRNKGYTILTGAKKELTKIKTLKNSINLERFIRKFKPNQETLLNNEISRSLDSRLINIITKNNKKINCEDFNNMIQYTGVKYTSLDYPNIFKKLNKRSEKRLREFNKIKNKYDRSIEKFGILNQVHVNSKNVSEFVDLVNYKLSKGNKNEI